MKKLFFKNTYSHEQSMDHCEEWNWKSRLFDVQDLIFSLTFLNLSYFFSFLPTFGWRVSKNWQKKLHLETFFAHLRNVEFHSIFLFSFLFFYSKIVRKSFYIFSTKVELQTNVFAQFSKFENNMKKTNTINFLVVSVRKNFPPFSHFKIILFFCPFWWFFQWIFLNLFLNLFWISFEWFFELIFWWFFWWFFFYFLDDFFDDFFWIFFWTFFWIFFTSGEKNAKVLGRTATAAEEERQRPPSGRAGPAGPLDAVGGRDPKGPGTREEGQQGAQCGNPRLAGQKSGPPGASDDAGGPGSARCQGAGKRTAADDHGGHVPTDGPDSSARHALAVSGRDHVTHARGSIPGRNFFYKFSCRTVFILALSDVSEN